MPRIYTKTGDKGETGLGNGERVFKDSARVEALGAVDELNAALGIARAFARHAEKGANGATVEAMLIAVQRDLFVVGTLLSQSRDGERVKLESRVAYLERGIDELSMGLPALAQFILPSGGAQGAQIHYARAVCRRAERRVAALLRASRACGAQDSAALIYLNRLSDFLFVLARWVNKQDGVSETVWRL